MKLSLLWFIVAVAVARDLDDYQVFEQLDTAPTPWTLMSNASLDTTLRLKLRIHLKNQNIDLLHQKVYNISTPDNPDYGNHMGKLELRELLVPSPKTYDLASEWLREAGLYEKAVIKNDWVIVDGTVSDAERLLRTEYRLFENTLGGQTIARTLEYSLPATLHGHIDMVAPTIKFSTPSAMRSTLVQNFEAPPVPAAYSLSQHSGLNETACNVTITPDCLKALYNFKHFRGARRNGNQLALAGFLEQYAQHDDLATFLGRYDVDAAGADFSTILINNGLNLQQNVSGNQSTGEANLDIQYGLSLAYPTPSIYVSTGGRPPENSKTEFNNEPYLEFVTHLLTLDSIPQTISISYGDAEWSVPYSYATTVCNLFAQFAARGVSVIVSSGDSGAGADRDCNVVEPGKIVYVPAFPASCPFVTAVGATRYVSPEQAVYFSGGGFSNYFAQPAYQASAVATYLSTYADPLNMQYFNVSGRAYPDVSTQGVHFHVIRQGKVVYESGTSASSPTVAAIVALLNGDRISNGFQPFGLLNPFLYANPTALTDITLGKGAGCSSLIPGGGYAAVVGWDPVTGLGTPDFKKLRLASTGL